MLMADMICTKYTWVFDASHSYVRYNFAHIIFKIPAHYNGMFWLFIAYICEKSDLHSTIIVLLYQGDY